MNLQIAERDIDRLMARTKLRPLADSRMPLPEAMFLAFGMTLAGLLMLAIGSNWLAALVALATAFLIRVS